MDRTNAFVAVRFSWNPALRSWRGRVVKGGRNYLRLALADRMSKHRKPEARSDR